LSPAKAPGSRESGPRIERRCGQEKNREKAGSIFIFYIIVKKMLFGKSVPQTGRKAPFPGFRLK
jgi:hypothetical protein